MQATWIRNAILSALRKTHPEIARKIPVNVVYQYSSILSLAAVISERARHGKDDADVVKFTNLPSFDSETSNIESKEYIQQLAEKYVSNLFTTVVINERKKEDCVLLTGSSGSLGVNLFAQMVKDRGIRRIYAVSRKPTVISLKEKLTLAFTKAGLDEASLKSSKVVLLSADLTLPDFGLGRDILEEVSALWSAICTGEDE